MIFKVGDRVRVQQHASCYFGCEGSVVKIEGSSLPYYVDFGALGEPPEGLIPFASWELKKAYERRDPRER